MRGLVCYKNQVLSTIVYIKKMSVPSHEYDSCYPLVWCVWKSMINGTISSAQLSISHF